MIRVYEQEVIIIPVLFLMTFLVILLLLLLLRYCPEKVDRLQPNSKRSTRNRRNLQGIDAPRGLNALEGERIALDTTSYMTFSALSTIKEHNPSDHASNNVAFADGRGSFGAAASAFTKPKELPRQRLPENFNGVSPLPASYSLKSDTTVSLYRARMENRNVVLCVLKDSASKQESESFLDFAAFLSQLGPNPFIPELLGVVSLRAPLITVIEEMENRDLLGFLWRCREDKVGPDGICEMTEKKIFTMALHVSTALDYLHSKDLIHCNIKARSVLLSRMYTAKLWGLGDLYARTSEKFREDPGRKKWQAPELLAKRTATPKSDVWSFGLMLYEMVTLGDVPFAEIPVTELLQYHQRGKTLKKPNNCSNSLYSIIKSCCQWKDHDRPSLADVRRKLQSGEKSANDSVVLRVPEPINIERYLREAGYGESNNYTIF